MPSEKLVRLRDVLASTGYPLSLPGAPAARSLAKSAAGQLSDYLIPRLAKLDAPLLAVAGGSTGAGKSTLINSIVGETVSPASARRPTTRAPVLVCHPEDEEWFSSRESREARVVTSTVLTPGLALLDAPDIDSVEEANRVLAEQLLAAADLWLFVTTAVRYADAVPWELLTDARDRGTAVAIILNRVPHGAETEVAPHLQQMLTSHGLTTAHLFTIAEQPLASGLLPPPAIAPLKDWLKDLAADAAAKAAVVRQTVEGAIAALQPTAAKLAAEADAQADAIQALRKSAEIAYKEAESEVAQGVQDGTLFRGEVLARWQELAGTGEFMRGLQATVGRWRDRLVSAVTGKPRPADELKEALESGLVTFVHSAAADAAERAAKAWKAHPAGMLRPGLSEASSDVDARADRLVRDWQRGVLELVRNESAKKLQVAKFSAYAVNALGVCLMIAVFAATAFIPTGAEIAVGAGTTVAAQKVLEAIFGDEAVRRLAGQARNDLLRRVNALLQEEASRFYQVLDESGVENGDRIREAAAAL